MEKSILTITGWLLFLGGLFGMAMGVWKFLAGGSPAEYGVMGIGGGAYLLSSAIVCYIADRISRK